MLFSLFFPLNYCFAAVVLIATNRVEYITDDFATSVDVGAFYLPDNAVGTCWNVQQFA